MKDEKLNQIIRKDAKNCFVESLRDSFEIKKIHLCFATYDLSLPEGKRQTNNVQIYIDVDKFLELCRQIKCGEFGYKLQQSKKSSNSKALFEYWGGTSAESLRKQGRERADDKSLSRIVKIIAGKQTDLLLIADSGPGEEDKNGLIVPRFGNKPENHVAVSMTLEALHELVLVTEVHYNAWLTTWYMKHPIDNTKQYHEKVNGNSPAMPQVF